MKSSVPDLVGSIPDYIAGLLVVIGWIVLYRQSLSLKRRDEVSLIVQRIIETIDEALDLCESYYSGNERDKISYRSSALKSKFRLLTRYLLLLNDAGVKIEAYPILARFKILATGTYFETSDFRKQADIPNWKQDLSSAAIDLRFTTERAYFQWSNGKLGRESQVRTFSIVEGGSEA